MKTASIQIQTVLFNNDVVSLRRALNSVQNAIRVARERDGLQVSVTVVHGDASPKRNLTDAEVASIEQSYGDDFEYRYVFFNENTGTSLGHNRLAADCAADYLVVQNPDIQYGPHFFARMLDPFGRPELKAGIVEARQMPLEHPKEYDPKTLETPWVTGACFMVPTRVYHEVGGFDPECFFMYCDDVDISWRVRLAGYTLFYQPLAPVFHPKYLSKDAHWCPTEAERYYSLEALLLMCYKWSHDSRLNRLLEEFESGDNALQQKAAATFRKRAAQNKLPPQLDKEHRVADINDEGYAHMRYFI